MGESTGVIEEYKDGSGVRHFTNRGAPSGAAVVSRESEIKPTGIADILDTLPDPDSYDVAGNTMRDVAQNKAALFQHTFGGTVSDERQLTPEQARLWRGNLNQLYAQANGQHASKRAAMAKKYERAIALQNAHRTRQEKIADAKTPKNAEDFFRQTAETLIDLKRVMDDPAAGVADRMRAEAKYKEALPKAMLYESLLMAKKAKPLGADEVDMIRAETEATWKAMSPEEQAQYPGGLDELETIAFTRAEELRRPPSVLARLGISEQGAAQGQRQPGDAQPGAPDPAVVELLPKVRDALANMPASQRQIVAGEIDAAAAQAKQTGDSAALVEAMQRVASATPAAAQNAGVNVNQLGPGQGVSPANLARSADAAVGGVIGVLDRAFPKQRGRGPLPESRNRTTVSRGQRG